MNVRRILAAVMLAPALAAIGTAAAQDVPSVSFIGPTDGAVVGGPRLEVWMDVTGFETVEAGQPVAPGEGHLHVYVDRDPPTTPGVEIPTDDPNIIHLGRSPFETRSIEAAEGEHTLHAVLADSAHRTLDPPVQTSIRVTLAPGYRGRGDLEPPCAEVAEGTGGVEVAFPIQGGQVQGVITTNCAFETEGGACSWVDVSRRRVLGTYDAISGEIEGTTFGETQRQLREGDPDTCGEGATLDAPEGTFRATVDDGVVTGALGQARFALEQDMAVTLEDRAPDEKTPFGEAAPAPGEPASGGVPWSIVGPLVVLALAGAAGGVMLLRRRTEAPAPASSGTSPPQRTPPPPSEPAEPATSIPSTPPQSAPPEPPSDAPPSEGAQEPPPDDEIRFCEECGTPRRSGSQFCPNCGYNF